jgi:hypothetical protein
MLYFYGRHSIVYFSVLLLTTAARYMYLCANGFLYILHWLLVIWP